MPTISTNYRTQVMNKNRIPVSSPARKPYSVTKTILKSKLNLLSDFCIIPTPQDISWLIESQSEIELENKTHSIITRHMDSERYGFI